METEFDDVSENPSPVPALHDENEVGIEEEMSVLIQKEFLRESQQNREQRKSYASNIYRLVKWWLIFIGALLMLQGLLSPWDWFGLSDTLLIIVASATTGSVTALLIIVVRYLFPDLSQSYRESMSRN